MLGEPVYAGLFIARKFDRCNCKHNAKEKLTGADCLIRVAQSASRQASGRRYMIGTQDRRLTEELRKVNYLDCMILYLDCMIYYKTRLY